MVLGEGVKMRGPSSCDDVSFLEGDWPPATAAAAADERRRGGEKTEEMGHMDFHSCNESIIVEKLEMVSYVLLLHILRIRLD